VKLGAGAITVFNKELDLCDTIDKYAKQLHGKDSLKCPIAADKKTWEQTVRSAVVM
jgi:hypothetical protein